MSDNLPGQPRRRIGQRILFGLFCLVLLSFFAVLVMNMSDKGGLNRFERQWEAKGEHFDFASFIPKPAPDAQNFALTPIVASSYEEMLDKNGHEIVPRRTNIVNRLGMELYGNNSLLHYPTNGGNWAMGTKTDLKTLQLYYRALAAKTNEFPVALQAQSPAADVLLALSKYDEPVEELRQAAALPYSRFPLSYDKERLFDILLPHLAALKKCSQVLQLRAVAELQNGQSDKALTDVKLLLRLVDSIRTEPILISHLVRIALLNLALQPVWEGLADHKWSDAQLTELNQELAKLDFLADYEFSMRGERAMSMAEIEYLRRTRNFNWASDNDNPTPVVVQAAYHLVPNSVFYQNELAIARGHQEWLLPVADVGRHTVSPAMTRLAATNLDMEFSHWSPNNLLARLMLPALTRTPQKFAYAQSALDMARVACALERCRLAQGEYPESLDALSPRLIETVPHDVIGGQPLKYRRTDNGKFALYSVGWNGTDDGGTVVSRKPSKLTIDYDNGDWVWAGQVMGSQ
jgi:hypothetical protein